MKKKLSVISEQLVSVRRLPNEYEVGTWAKLPQWRCKFCGFDTLLNEQTMLEHLVNAHNSEPALELLVGPVEISESEVKSNAKDDHEQNAGGGTVPGLGSG